LGVGGSLIFYFIYFPKGGKGSFFHGTWIYDLIQHLASRNFVYIAFYLEFSATWIGSSGCPGSGPIFLRRHCTSAKKSLLDR